MNIFLIIFSSLIANNIVLSQTQGLCPFLGVSKKTDSAVGMGLAVTFVIALSSVITYLIYHYALIPLGIEYMQTLTFILVIACLVQITEIIVKFFSPTLYRSLGVYLPLITTNCAVLGTANTIIYDGYNLLEAFVLGVSTGLGFMLAIVLMSGIRQKLLKSDIPKCFKGFPITLVTAAIMALAFAGFSGLFA